ncbi:hypothetical protein [Atlantibacter hermannii]|uniref:hypothetical protein n=1 Tax=Atlantibacter hermannii TaxID=565 RepID=UPI0022B78909|nr:hypothetical protein [Atlantibacter hermannii]MCZ7836030.1 hypothetical protein [Atlantibacter hermannii]
MRNFLLALLALGLTGCSTSSLEKDSPIFAGHSSKSPDEFNKCLAPKWVALKASSASIPTSTGFQISSSDEWFGAVSLVKIDKASDGGSNIKVYALSKGWNDPWGSAARSCL